MATYYVDATGGNDGWAGTSTTAAWQTIAKVNAAALVAGDSVLFKRGETWTGTTLIITWSGALGNPITFGAYGSGDRPIIDGNDLVNGIVAIGRDHVTFEYLECLKGLPSGLQFTNCDYITVTECDGSYCANDNLIFLSGCHDCSVSGGSFTNGTGAIGASSGIEITDSCYNITVDDVDCSDNAHLGILVQCHNFGTRCYNITITNARCNGNGLYGIDIGKGDVAADVGWNVNVYDSTFNDNGNTGIRVSNPGGSANYVNGVLFDKCTAFGNGSYGMTLLGDDIQMQRTAAMGENTIISCVGVTLDNLTLYSTLGVGTYALAISGARIDGVTMRNTIIQCTDGAGGVVNVAAGATINVDIDYTLYDHPDTSLARWVWNGVAMSYVDWLTNSGQDANSPMAADPLFINAANDNFHLECESPAVDAGIDVGLDYSGDAPDCGAYEYQLLLMGTFRVWKPDGKPELIRESLGRFAVWIDVPRCPS